MSMSKDLLGEAGRARFKANFGSELCESCDGLKAGPDVLSTCYQMRQCHFTNIKVSEPRRAQIVERLSASPRKRDVK